MNEIERRNFEFLNENPEEDELKQMLLDIMFNKPEETKIPEEEEKKSTQQINISTSSTMNTTGVKFL